MKSYEELLALYNKILEENKKLKSENAELKRQLGIAELSVATADLPEAAVTKHSSPQEKITLFRSLFHGRDDVFARRKNNSLRLTHCFFIISAYCRLQRLLEKP